MECDAALWCVVAAASRCHGGRRVPGGKMRERNESHFRFLRLRRHSISAMEEILLSWIWRCSRVTIFCIVGNKEEGGQICKGQRGGNGHVRNGSLSVRMKGLLLSSPIQELWLLNIEGAIAASSKFLSGTTRKRQGGHARRRRRRRMQTSRPERLSILFVVRVNLRRWCSRSRPSILVISLPLRLSSWRLGQSARFSIFRISAGNTANCVRGVCAACHRRPHHVL